MSFAIVSSIVPTACAGDSRDSNAVLSIPHFLQNKEVDRFSQPSSTDSSVNDMSRDMDKEAFCEAQGVCKAQHMLKQLITACLPSQL